MNSLVTAIYEYDSFEKTYKKSKRWFLAYFLIASPNRFVGLIVLIFGLLISQSASAGDKSPEAHALADQITSRIATAPIETLDRGIERFLANLKRSFPDQFIEHEKEVVNLFRLWKDEHVVAVSAAVQSIFLNNYSISELKRLAHGESVPVSDVNEGEVKERLHADIDQALDEVLSQMDHRLITYYLPRLIELGFSKSVDVPKVPG